MQTPKAIEVTQEALESYEYQVIQSTIDEMSKVLVTIQDGMSSEFAQVQTLNKILDSQLKMLENLSTHEVVSMEQVRLLKVEYKMCLNALRHKADTIKSLNAYMNDRIGQMNLLQRKREEIIRRFTPAQVLEFKGRNEKRATDESGD